MTRSRFVLTSAAREDLFEIWNYIAEDSIDNANKVLDRLQDAFLKLSRLPGIGHYREDLADRRHRFWNVYSYVIAYRWESKPLQIIAIVHGARHLEAFFHARFEDEHTKG